MWREGEEKQFFTHPPICVICMSVNKENTEQPVQSTFHAAVKVRMCFPCVAYGTENTSTPKQ